MASLFTYIFIGMAGWNSMSWRCFTVYQSWHSGQCHFSAPVVSSRPAGRLSDFLWSIGRGLTLAFTVVGRIWPSDPALYQLQKEQRERGSSCRAMMTFTMEVLSSLKGKLSPGSTGFTHHPGLCYVLLQLLLLLSHFSHVWLCATPWTAAHQAPLSLGFSRQEYWSGLPFPSPMHACMHAKSIQSCPTLCDPMDSSPPGSSVHGIL